MAHFGFCVCGDRAMTAADIHHATAIASPWPDRWMSERSSLSNQLRRTRVQNRAHASHTALQNNVLDGDHTADGPAVRIVNFRQCGDDQEPTQANGSRNLKIVRRICLVLSYRKPPSR
jgi:hypothetical protein